MHGQGSQDSSDEKHGPGEIDEETNNLKTLQCMTRYVEAYV